VAAWSVANEVLSVAGLRTDVPWYQTIGPTYVEEAFRAAHAADPDAMLLLNDFGFETDQGFELAADKRSAALRYLEQLLRANVPVHALGVQAHLTAERFADRFDPAAYRRYLDAVMGEPAVPAVMTFGLSDRDTWLQEDHPRHDDAGDGR
jgi:endo-1,4-beta-xylanase